MATLVDDERVPVEEAVSRVQEKFGAKGNSRSKCLGCTNYERELRALAELFDKAMKARVQNNQFNSGPVSC